MDQIERRAFMKGAGSGVLAFTVGGAEVLLTPGAARTQGVPFRTLTAAQGETLEALGETLVPGARKPAFRISSTSRFRVPADEALLEARIFNVRPPFANFYRAALGAVDRGSEKVNNGRKFCALAKTNSAVWSTTCARTRSKAGRTERSVRLSPPAQRCRRCRLRHDGGLCRPRHSLHAPHRADQEVVTWRTKK